MKTRKTIAFITPLCLLMILPPVLGKTRPDGKMEEKDEKILIPKEIKIVIEENLVARQPLQGIPFEIVRFLYLPTKQNVHAVFLLKIKNSDLSYLPVTSGAGLERKTGREIDFSEQKKSPEEQKPHLLRTDFKIFVQIYEGNKGKPEKVIRESYVPASFTEETATFNPAKENLYSVGYPLPAGNYLLSLAITSPDLKKIGLRYLEFSLPGLYSFQNRLELTSVVFLESYKEIPSPEIVTKIHKNSFVYSTLEIIPKMANVFSQGEAIDILYFIYGCEPESGTNKYNITIRYAVKRGDETVLGFKEQLFQFPFISHPLPLLDRDNQPLPPGSYVLDIVIKDEISGNSLSRDVEFDIK